MNFSSLTYRNIRYYARYYRLMAAAVMITVAVITGSMLVGDSVRTTLAKRVAERLGDAETIIFSYNSFISDEIMTAPLLRSSAQGILLVNGFISHQGKLIPVYVFGDDHIEVQPGMMKINKALAGELGSDYFGHKHGSDALALRLPATGLVPSGSLFVTENYTTALRLAVSGVVEANEGGNLSLKNEQTIPFNVFVNRAELAENLEVKGKINLILSSKSITEDEFAEAWEYRFSGLKALQHADFTELTSDRVFLQQDVVQAISADNQAPNRLFSYLANNMQAADSCIPYSFITATDRYKSEVLQNDEIILSDYSAGRLNVAAGDKVSVSYYKSKDLKTLIEDSLTLKVKRIVPLQEILADSTLSAHFPGLSDVEKCTDWDSDLPVNMDLITDEDERYWELYRNAPKAIVAYNALAPDWSNTSGTATAVRIANARPELSALRPEMFGIQLISPRASSMFAAQNGVDFAGLFLSLGFFIIIAAMLLMKAPVSEMLFQRQNEINVLQSIGYSRKRIIRILWHESYPVVLASSIAGVLLGLLYTGLIMWLFGNVWKGATHTDGFTVYPSIPSIATGLVAGIALSLCFLRITIARSNPDRWSRNIAKSLNMAKSQYIAKSRHIRKSRHIPKSPNKEKINFSNPARVSTRVLTIAIPISALAVATIAASWLWLSSVVLFVVSGVLILGTSALWGYYAIC
ncbi:MAG: ABC transporter permease, partial [Tannerella sp.]|nr:ABC transporter permease [Tannerella sp.]